MTPAQKLKAWLFQWHRPIAALVALSPPLGCAWFAESSGRWDLFERTGSITTAIGLTLASRRYLQHGIAELALLHADSAQDLNAEEDIHSTKLGLALSAFGTIVWGWGSYLGWWSFLFVAPWAMMALRDVWRDRRLHASSMEDAGRLRSGLLSRDRGRNHDGEGELPEYVPGRDLLN